FVGGRLSVLVPTDFARTVGKSTLGRFIIGDDAATVLTNADHSVRIEVLGKEPARQGKSGYKAPGGLLLKLVKTGARDIDPSAEWLSNDVRTFGDHKYLFLDFRPTHDHLGTRQLLALTEADDGFVFLVGFSCDVAQEESWVPVGKQVVDSVVTRG